MGASGQLGDGIPASHPHGQARRLGPGWRASGPAVRLLRTSGSSPATSLAEVSEVVRGLVCRDEPEDYRLIFRVYGIDGMYPLASAAESDATRDLHRWRMRPAERAGAVVHTTKRYLLHHEFSGPALDRGQRRSPRRNCPAARRTASTSITSCKSTGWRRCSRSRSRICDWSRAAASPYGAASSQKGKPGTLEPGCLEKCCPLRGTEGSNPSPSTRRVCEPSVPLETKRAEAC